MWSVCLILRRLGPFALRTGKKKTNKKKKQKQKQKKKQKTKKQKTKQNTQVGVYPFQCKVYVHCIHCVFGHSGVDRKDKLYTLRTLFW